MKTLTSGFSYVDLNFLGVPRVIATAVLNGPGGVALVDPGPTSTLPTLKRALGDAGIAMRDVRDVLLTHIHLDHAGATGTMVKENPALRVHVHEKGAPHMAEPEKLIASATRLYGAEMDRLWGEFLPVPRDAIAILSGGERITAGGRSLDVLYTPGHASHHVSYFSADAGVALVGDTLGVRLRDRGFIMPPTPPPDIDLEAWHDSLARIEQWHAETFFITHFGPHAPSAAHAAELADRLAWTSGLVRESLARDGTDEEREAWFTGEIRSAMTRGLRAPDRGGGPGGEDGAQAYEVAGPFELSWRGLARYWRKRA